MQGDKGVVEYLNKVLKNELTAINQYFLHSRLLDNWGVMKLASKAKEESIDEMKHANALIDRIILIEGMPQMQTLNKLMVGQNCKETLEADLGLEKLAIGDLKAGIAHCESVGDYVSRDLLRGILDEEEGHVDWIETQLDLIGRIGIERYEQAMM